jgi:hypothetical protein
MRGSRFNPLQNLNQTVDIPIQIAKRSQQKMHMVRHHHHRMDRRLSSLIVQTMSQHEISNRRRQGIKTAATKGNKQHPVSLLIMRKPPTVSVLAFEQFLGHEV